MRPISNAEIWFDTMGTLGVKQDFIIEVIENSRTFDFFS